MRKLLWTCMFSGVLLSGGVISTAYFAVHHPDSLIGRVLFGASHIASVINPVIGLTPLAKHADAMASAEEQCADGEQEVWQLDPIAVPDDPVPAAGEEANAQAPEPGPIVVANNGTAPIVICEDDKASTPIPEHQKVDDFPPGGPASYCEPAGSISPTAAVCPSNDSTAAPQVMPYCNDEEVHEMLPMPSEELPVLPMPRLIEDEDTDGLSLGKEPIRDTQFLPCIGCPAGMENLKETFRHAMHQKLHAFGSQDDEDCPEHPEIDTMEFRPSDCHLYEFGPGSL
jgi:hypothetical protein